MKLEAGDEKDLRAALGVLLPHAAPAPHLEAATRRLQAMAQKVHVESYLSHMVRFYDVQDRVPKEFVVNLLDSAGLSIQATVYGEQIVLPMSVQHLDSEERVQGELGVVVHELGHAMMAQVPDDVRRRVSDTLVHHLGIVQRRHYNIFDEATQTAVGNVLFMNGAFPGTVQDDQFLYNYESDNPKPHAIDHLARFLSPVLAQHFATPGSFAQTYLDDAIAQHEKAFGNAPRYHTRVARVVVGDADGSTLRRIFDQLFWGTSRESMSIEDFVESEVSANPGLTRWALLTGDSRTIDAKRLADSFPMVAEVAEALGLRGACFRAKRRGPGRGYDMVVVGQSVASVRDVLIQIHGMTAVPDDIWCSGPAERKMQ